MPGRDVIVVGASAGGVEALARLSAGLPPGLPASLFVVCHYPPGGRSVLPDILSRSGPLLAAHAADGEPFHPGHIYVAPPDRHLVLTADGRTRLTREARENRHRPAADPLFRSAARHYGPRVIGVVLSGGLYDGAAGLLAVRAAGGMAVVQDPADAVVAAMPRAATAADPQFVVPIAAMPALLTDLVRRPAAPDPGGRPMDAMDPIDRMPEVVDRHMAAQARNERRGEVSTFTCPECGGALWQVDQAGVVRFRCHVGHAYHGDALLAEQGEALEAALWTAVRTFREKAVLARQLATAERDRGNPDAAGRYAEQADQDDRYVRLIVRHVLRADPGGDPEPPPAAPPDPPAADHPRLHEVGDLSPDAQLVTCGHGLVRAANRAAADLLGVRKEFLVGKPLGLFFAAAHRPRFYKALSRLWRGAGSDAFEAKAEPRGGGERDVAVRAVADGGGGGRADVAMHWLVRDLTEVRQAEAARTDLLRRLVTAQEDERRRVSRELHDGVGQLLTALGLAAQAVRRAGPLPPAADAKLADVERLADDLGRELHRLAVRLRPTALDDVGLEAALDQHLRDWSARTGVAVDFQPTGRAAERLPPDVETALYRVVQEALTNVARHAGATAVGVAVSRHDGTASVTVEDNGVGFEAAAAGRGRLGLVGMRERVAAVGGVLDVASRPGEGTTVLVRVPLAAPTGRPATAAGPD